MLLLYLTTCQLFILVYWKRLSLREYIVHMFLIYFTVFQSSIIFYWIANSLLQRLHSPYASYIFNCQSFIICYYITIDSAAETLESICFLGILLFVSHLLYYRKLFCRSHTVHMFHMYFIMIQLFIIFFSYMDWALRNIYFN